MAISFIFPPFVSSLLTYSALYTEIVSLYTAVQVPWATSLIIYGFLLNGQDSLLQAIVLGISILIYIHLHERWIK